MPLFTPLAPLVLALDFTNCSPASTKHVVDARRLRPGVWIELDGMIIDVANGEVGDQHVASVADPNPVGDIAVARVAHATTDEQDVIAGICAAADSDILDVAVQPERAGQIVGPRLDQDGGP